MRDVKFVEADGRPLGSAAADAARQDIGEGLEIWRALLVKGAQFYELPPDDGEPSSLLASIQNPTYWRALLTAGRTLATLALGHCPEHLALARAVQAAADTLERLLPPEAEPELEEEAEL